MAVSGNESPSEQHYSLKWNDYSVKLVTAFQSLRDEEDFVDVTVACDGHQYSAHKMVLSACSPYFRAMLRTNPCQHPIVILKDVGHSELERLLEFMYNGEVNIAQDQLAAFLRTAENLKIRGLAGSSDDMEQLCNRDYSNLLASADKQHSSSVAVAGGGGSREDEQTLGSSNIQCYSPLPKKRKVILLDGSEHDGGVDEDQQNMDTSDATTAAIVTQAGSMGVDVKCLPRDLKAEPCESMPGDGSSLSEVYGGNDGAGGGAVMGVTDATHDQILAAQPHMYTIGVSGGGNNSTGSSLTSPSAGAGHHQDLSAGHHSDQGDVSALMAIANAVQATAPSERPIKCPLCQNIIKHARNLRRHVFKRHLPAAQRGEITETDVKNVLERKLKAITVTPLTDDELREVQQRIRRRGFKAPRKKKGVAALPAELNTANIDENEVTIRKLPVKKDKRLLQSSTIVIPTNILPEIVTTATQIGELPRADVIVSPREDILQEALAARDKDPQEEVMDLAITQEQQHQHHQQQQQQQQQQVQQQQLPPISVVVSQTLPQAVHVASHPMSLTVTQTAGGIHARIPAEAALQAGVRLQTDTSLHIHRELMHPMTFEPQVAISESLATYHTTSPSQVLAQTSSPISSSSAAYVPGCYWTTTSPSVAGLSGTTFQTHQPVFAAPAHAEYFTTTGVQMTTGRQTPVDRGSVQQRRKPCQ